MRQLNEKFSDDRDVELLSAVARGDRKALEALYAAYHRRLARFLSRLAQRYDTVEEIINDTFMVVWQHAGEFRGASRVSTWIIGIAYRTALKSLRRTQTRLKTHSRADVAEMSAEPNNDVELRDWVSQGLNHLPLEQRLVLELAYHLGHSIEEIAAITECPVGTVKARMFHAREKLREYLPALAGTVPTNKGRP
jgi:RNA polymerase sigma-70 factor, ECF subfamily